MIAKTLHYLGADSDISFLAYLPLYQSYRLYDLQQDDEFRDIVNTVFASLINSDEIDFKYAIGHDCSKPMELDGDVYVCGYAPDWLDTYAFTGRVFLSANSYGGEFPCEIVGKADGFLDSRLEFKFGDDGGYLKHKFNNMNVINDETREYLANAVRTILTKGREAFEEDLTEDFEEDLSEYPTTDEESESEED